MENINFTFFSSLDQSNIEETLIDSQVICKDCSKITFTEFAKYLNLSTNDPIVQQLFRYYDKVTNPF